MLSITVNTLMDENDGVGIGAISLRDAIAAASPGETINFSTSNPDLSGGTIVLQHGEIPFSRSLTIDASMLSQGITIDASGSDPHSRIFNISDLSGGNDPPLVTIKHLTMTGPRPQALRRTPALHRHRPWTTNAVSGRLMAGAASACRETLFELCNPVRVEGHETPYPG